MRYTTSKTVQTFDICRHHHIIIFLSVKSIEEPDSDNQTLPPVSLARTGMNIHFPTSEVQLSDQTQLLQIAERERENREQPTNKERERIADKNDLQTQLT